MGMTKILAQDHTHTSITEQLRNNLTRSERLSTNDLKEDNGTVSSRPTESTELNQARPSQVTGPKLDRRTDGRL